MKQRSEPDARDEREERKRKQKLRRIASTNLSDSQQGAAHQSLRRRVKPKAGQDCLAKGRPEHVAVPPTATGGIKHLLPMHPSSMMRSATHSQITLSSLSRTHQRLQRTRPDSMERSDRKGEESRTEQTRSANNQCPQSRHCHMFRFSCCQLQPSE